MVRQRLRVAVPVVAVAALIGGVAASQAHHAGPTTAQKAYHVSAALKGTGASGLISGDLTTSGTKGSLSWKLTLTPSGTASSAQIRGGATGAGALLVSLCAPCAASAHGTKTVSGSALTTLVAGHAGAVVKTSAHATLRGAVRAAVKSGGGGLTIVPTPTLVAQGKTLTAKQSCGGCHTLDGTKSTGPTWKGLAGSKVHLTDGTTITATDTYLVNVIEDASTLNVAGYDPSLMASYIPPGTITHTQAIALVAYIKTIK